MVVTQAAPSHKTNLMMSDVESENQSSRALKKNRRQLVNTDSIVVVEGVSRSGHTNQSFNSEKDAET